MGTSHTLMPCCKLQHLRAGSCCACSTVQCSISGCSHAEVCRLLTRELLRCRLLRRSPRLHGAQLHGQHNPASKDLLAMIGKGAAAGGGGGGAGAPGAGSTAAFPGLYWGCAGHASSCRGVHASSCRGVAAVSLPVTSQQRC